MLRRASFLAAAALMSLYWMKSGQADETMTVHRSPTLTERLQQFRDDLLGDPRPAPRKPVAPSRNGQGSPGSQPAASNSGNAAAASSSRKPGPKYSPTPTSQQGVPQMATLPRASAGPQIGEEQARPVFQPARRAEPTPAIDWTPPDDSGEMSLQDKLAAVRRSAADKQEAATTPTQPVTVPKNSEVSSPSMGIAISPPIEDSPTETPHVARIERRDTVRSIKTEAPPKPPEKVVEKTPEKPREALVEKPAATRTPERQEKKADNVLFSSRSAQLSVDASGPRKILIGKEATFTVHLQNTGDVVANNVVVTVNIPGYAEIAGVQPSTGSTRAPSITGRTEPLEWTINRLAGRGRETLTLRLIPRKSSPLDLAIQWTCSPEATQTLVEVQEPKLLVGLSGPDEVLYGQSKIYKLTLSNPGNGDAENVVVNLMPIGHGGEGTANHRLGSLKAGESKAVEVELTARQAGALVIKAQAFADGGLRAEVSQDVLVRRANLKMDISGPKVKYAGTPGTYHVHVTNTGTASAENAQISALLPAGAKFISCGGGGRHEPEQAKVSWNAGALQPGSERDFELQCSFQTAGENRIQMMALADGDLSASAMSATRVEALADLKLEVHDPQGPVSVTDEAVYDVVIRNRGTKGAENIELAVFFSEGLEATAVQGGPHEIGKGQVAFKPIGSLAAGSEAVFRIHAKAERAGNLVFRAEVVCESLHTKLATEETTRFYGDEPVTQRLHAAQDRPERRAMLQADSQELEPEPSLDQR